MESVLSPEEDARAELVARVDLVSTTGKEVFRHSMPSESATDRAARSLVNTEAL